MQWPRFDPGRGYWLCENCWNGRHSPEYSHLELIKGRRVFQAGTICQCPCPNEEKPARKPKPRPGDQRSIPMANPLAIGTKS